MRLGRRVGHGGTAQILTQRGARLAGLLLAHLGDGFFGFLELVY
jgi:hypothetical protein